MSQRRGKRRHLKPCPRTARLGAGWALLPEDEDDGDAAAAVAADAAAAVRLLDDVAAAAAVGAACWCGAGGGQRGSREGSARRAQRLHFAYERGCVWGV